jgi:hypothetical protein
MSPALLVDEEGRAIYLHQNTGKTSHTLAKHYDGPDLVRSLIEAGHLLHLSDSPAVNRCSPGGLLPPKGKFYNNVTAAIDSVPVEVCYRYNSGVGWTMETQSPVRLFADADTERRWNNDHLNTIRSRTVQHLHESLSQVSCGPFKMIYQGRVVLPEHVPSTCVAITRATTSQDQCTFSIKPETDSNEFFLRLQQLFGPSKVQREREKYNVILCQPVQNNLASDTTSERSERKRPRAQETSLTPRDPASNGQPETSPRDQASTGQPKTSPTPLDRASNGQPETSFNAAVTGKGKGKGKGMYY